MYATRDAVAMDTLATEIIERYRKQNGLRSLGATGRPVAYLETAEALGIWVANPNRISLETVTLP